MSDQIDTIKDEVGTALENLRIHREHLVREIQARWHDPKSSAYCKIDWMYDSIDTIDYFYEESKRQIQGKQEPSYTTYLKFWERWQKK